MHTSSEKLHLLLLFACFFMCLCVDMCTSKWVPVEAKNGHKKPWNWSYQFWVTYCLGARIQALNSSRKRVFSGPIHFPFIINNQTFESENILSPLVAIDFSCKTQIWNLFFSIDKCYCGYFVIINIFWICFYYFYLSFYWLWFFFIN